ncbi:hypothetical protein POTOM_032318 [Populus tomentosa]|uniref:Uncharacterized protein n=1 Tax=Populus tomentosa TaxID=118781 RepID=A0A8X7ZK59_POPTO|nr:hypothetical protein POTOM_032318 [Populus tomentosa]
MAASSYHEGNLQTKLQLLDSMLQFLTSFMEILLLDKGFEDAKHVIEALDSKGVSAIRAVSFCWGGETSFSPYCHTILINHNLLKLRLSYMLNHIL